MERILLTGLIKIELPVRDILLCDGGFLSWGGDTYRASDEDFGILTGFDALTEGTGDEAPAGILKLAPPSTAAAALLSSPGYQGARVRLWVSDVDESTGLVLGEPDLMADWQIDSTRLRIGRGTRELEIGCVTRGQRLLLNNDGNTLSPAFHRAIHPAEAGLDNATGLDAQVAWGTASPPRGLASTLRGIALTVAERDIPNAL